MNPTTYSTRRRTALVLTGSGTAGAYHAGVLHALHEAGVRIDIVAGRGAGAIGAMFAAVDGGQRLWEKDGLWKQPMVRRAYGWRWPVKLTGWTLLLAAALLAVPLALFAIGVAAALVGVVLSLIGFTSASTAITSGYSRMLDALFAPAALPTIVPRLIVLVLLCAAVALAGHAVWAAGHKSRGAARRSGGRSTLWQLAGAPLSSHVLLDRTVAELWNLIRGAATIAAPPREDLGRRYAELLAENVGQPGFRELLLVAHDVDARTDLVFGLLAEVRRSAFFGRRSGDRRPMETFDLAGVGREHIMDALSASLAVPVGTAPHLLALSAEGPWRGETHRVSDRPGALTRLLDEAARAGAEQAIIVSAAPPEAKPHELSTGRADPRGRAAEQLGAFETAGLRDALAYHPPELQSVFVIQPSHNALGPLDFAGVYDERSDREYQLSELVDRGYEDAYRQFIEPVVGAAAETAQAGRG